MEEEPMGGEREVTQALERRLLEERRSLRERLLRLQKIDTAPAIRDTPEAHVRTTDTADMAADSFRNDLQWMTRENLLARVAQLDRAYRKLMHESYGICEGCGTDVPAKRLEAMPDAAYCLSCQEEREGTRRRA
ncbi:MAG: TraR/DksA family transcriptional regulator [Candidatus Methylomirabilales bacterium]